MLLRYFYGISTILSIFLTKAVEFFGDTFEFFDNTVDFDGQMGEEFSGSR